MNSFIKEFKSFAVKGNVLDMAVGIIIGAGFGKIVSSFVNDIIMPPIGLLMGGVDFSEKVLVLKDKTADAAAVVVKYGLFVNHIIDFIIVAFAIFIVIKAMNKMKKEEATAVAAPPAPSAPAPSAGPSVTEQLLTEIRDALKK